MVWGGLENVLLFALRRDRICGELEDRASASPLRHFFCDDRKALAPEEAKTDRRVATINLMLGVKSDNRDSVHGS